MKKSKLTIINILLIVILSITIVYALINFVISYYYNVEAHSNIFVNNITNEQYYNNNETQLQFKNLQNDKEVLKGNSFDIIINSSDSTLEVLKNSNPIDYELQELEDNTYLYIYKDIKHDSSDVFNISTTARYTLYSLPYFTNNSYICSLDDLIGVSNHLNEMTTGSDNIRNNIYLIKDISINKELTLNLPAYINLLLSDIVLNENLTINNHYDGIYAIETISGVISSSSSKKLIINAPNALYLTHDLSDEVNLLIEIINTNFDFDTLSSNQLNYLIDEALTYALSKVSSVIYSDIPEYKIKFNSYPITINYTLLNNDVALTYEELSEISNYLEVSVKIEIYFDGVLQTTNNSINSTVIGDTKLGLTKALSLELDKYIKSNYTNSGITSQIKLNEVIDHTIKQVIDNNDTSYEGDYDFSVDLGYLKFSDELNTQINNYFNYFILRINSDNTYNYIKNELSFNTIYLSPLPYVLNTYISNIIITYDTVTYTIENIYAIKNCTNEEIKDYFNRYTIDIEINTDNDGEAILSLNDSNYIMYDGEVIVKDDSLYDNIEHNMYVISTSSYEQYKNGEITLDEVIANSISNIANEFIIEDGILKVVDDTSLSILQGQTIIYTVSLEDSSNNTVDYLGCANIYWPKNGVGGGGNTSYFTGNTFKEFFDDNHELVSTDQIKGDNYFAGAKNIKLEMSIENIDEVESYCNLIYDNDGDFYKINIETHLIPTMSSIVNIKCVFKTQSLVGGAYDKIASTQLYEFVIPGILTCKEEGSTFDEEIDEFDSTQLYNYIVNAKENDEYLYESYDGYLINKFSNEVEVIDFSSLSGLTINPIGIGYLSNTSQMIFDGVKLTSLLPFKDLVNVKTLSLNNCGITDSLLETKYLNGMNSLQTLNLDNNSISGGANYFYRSIKELSIQNQKDGVLKSISFIEELPNINILHIENNNIKSFKSLLKLSSLKEVYLKGNNPTCSFKDNNDQNTYFGTNGKVNDEVFVNLLLNNVNIYKEKDNNDYLIKIYSSYTDTGYNNDLDYTQMEIRNILVANAIVYSKDKSSIMIFKDDSQTIYDNNELKFYVYDINTNEKVECNITQNSDHILVSGINTSIENIGIIIEIAIQSGENKEHYYKLLEFN